jgi:hypothetical protein
MATYVNDLRLKEIGTGESSGTWGTETNVNLELIGEALSFGTEGITTNADTHTSTVADGSTDPARSMYIKYTGTLDSACTITIAPNTLSRLHFIENGTSGSQNIIISQGSGANVTIPPGDVKVVYLDGAGSGAAVVDAFASLSTVDLKVQDDLTVTDDVSIGGALVLTGNADFNGDLDVDGTTNLDVVDIDGAVDMASTLQVDGAITSSAGATITTADNTNQLTLVSTDADAAVGPVLDLYRNSGSPADDDFLGKINFRGRNDNSQDVNYGFLSYFISDASDGTEDAFMQMGLMIGGSSTLMLEASPTEIAFNQSGSGQNFRVETSASTHALFVDNSNNHVNIGGSSDLGGLLNVAGDINLVVGSGNPAFTIKTAGTGNNPAVFYRAGDNVVFDNMLVASASTDYWRVGFGTSGSVATEVLTVSTDAKVGVGTVTPADPLHVAGNLRVSTTTADGTELRLKVTPGGAGDNGTVALYQDDGSTAGVFLQADGACWFTKGINPGSGDTTAANVLDDYEEGTYTPALSISGDASGFAYAVQVGEYVKIGKLVTANVNIQLSSLGTATGSIQCNLPFSSDNTGNFTQVGVCILDNASTTAGAVGLQVGADSQTASLLTANTANNLAALQQSAQAANFRVRFSFTYKTQ